MDFLVSKPSTPGPIQNPQPESIDREPLGGSSGSPRSTRAQIARRLRLGLGLLPALLWALQVEAIPSLKASGSVGGAKLGNLGDSEVVLTRAGSFPGVRGVVGMEILDGRAVVLDATGLSVFDLADPLHPALLGRTNLVGTHLAAAPGLALVGEGRTVQIFDTSSPANLRRLSSYAVSSLYGIGRLPEMGGMVLEANLLYLGLAGGLLEIVDVSNPTAPRKVGSNPSIRGYPDSDGSGGGGVAVGATQAFTSVYDSGGLGRHFTEYRIRCLNKTGFTEGTTPPGQLPRDDLGVIVLAMPGSGSTAGNLNPGAMRWRDGLLYVGATDGGFQVLSFANPASPAVRSRFVTAGRCLDVALEGDSAFLAAGTGGVEVVDIRNPASIRQRGRLSLDASVSMVRVSGSLVFASGPSLGLEIVQVQSATVEPVAQTLTFELPTEVNEVHRFGLSATASSGLPVEFSLVSSELSGTTVERISNGSVDPSQVFWVLVLRPPLDADMFLPAHGRPNRGPWAVTVRASQAGDAGHLPVQVDRTMRVSYATRIGIGRPLPGAAGPLIQIPDGELALSLPGVPTSYFVRKPNYMIQFSPDMVGWIDHSGPYVAGSDPVSVNTPEGASVGYFRLVKVP